MSDSPSSTDGAGRVGAVISKMRLAADMGTETIPGVARMIGEWADEIETAVEAERERTRVLEEALRRIVEMREYDFHTGDGDVVSPPEIARDALAAVAVEDDEDDMPDCTCGTYRPTPTQHGVFCPWRTEYLRRRAAGTVAAEPPQWEDK